MQSKVLPQILAVMDKAVINICVQVFVGKMFQPICVKKYQPLTLLEGLILKLKLQYFGHLMQRVDSLEKTLMLGGIGGRRRRG